MINVIKKEINWSSCKIKYGFKCDCNELKYDLYPIYVIWMNIKSMNYVRFSKNIPYKEMCLYSNFVNS